MTKELEKEFESLIDFAWFHYDQAIEAGDEAAAEIWKQEAFDLLSKLPENAIFLKDMQ